MRAGNVIYRAEQDLSECFPVFPLREALLLPGGRMPLNIFEPRYLAMIEAALMGERIIGMIQPSINGAVRNDGEPELCAVGCMGRMTSYAETGDGRCLVTIEGICRFRVVEELETSEPFRSVRARHFVGDLDDENDCEEVDRSTLIKTFRDFVDANSMEVDWESVMRVDNETLVNALCMMSPYGAAEKQAMLEAPDLKTRAETLIAITELQLAREAGSAENLQ